MRIINVNANKKRERRGWLGFKDENRIGKKQNESSKEKQSSKDDKILKGVGGIKKGMKI